MKDVASAPARVVVVAGAVVVVSGTVVVVVVEEVVDEVVVSACSGSPEHAVTTSPSATNQEIVDRIAAMVSRSSF